jgi:hypothetical protein
MNSQDERRDVRAKIRSYPKDGETKNVYITVGTAWVSEHGSKISIQLDSVPVTPEWDGKLYINKPYEPKQDSRPMPTSTVMDEAYKDKLPNDSDAGDRINLSDIPFLYGRQEMAVD